MNIQPPLLLFEWISAALSLKKRRGGMNAGVETETTMSTSVGSSSGRLRAPGIEEDRNAKAVPQLDPRPCRGDGGEEGDDDEHQRGAKRRWNEPNAGDGVLD
jgi:hypothetical protein